MHKKEPVFHHLQILTLTSVIWTTAMTILIEKSVMSVRYVRSRRVKGATGLNVSLVVHGGMQSVPGKTRRLS